MREAPAARAASVASELLAFYREPVRHRTHYLHGEQDLPDGGVVFRLALGRFPHGWLRDMPAAERDEVRAAARAFVRQVCLWDRATHYQLLCVGMEAKREAIRECYHLLIALVHPDRQEAACEEWPTGCAQRANLAYETLTERDRRAAYDASFAKGPERAAYDPPRTPSAISRGRSRVPAATIAKRFCILASVIAVLFIVQAWWVSESSPQHALLERSFRASQTWMRGVLPDVPRFIAANTPAFDPGERLEPLKEPRRLAPLSSWIPVAQTPAAPGVEAAPMRTSNPEPVATPAPAPPPASTGLALRIAPTSTGARSEAPVMLAQATPTTPVPSSAPAKPANPGPSRDEIERVIALMVGYYDAGDAPRLVGLIDPDALGYWRGFRVRSAYADFFGATRDRRLRMDRLTWQVNGTAAQARGEATVIAEYQDGRGRVEQRIPIEVDIVQRDGEARLTRLVLYPVID